MHATRFLSYFLGCSFTVLLIFFDIEIFFIFMKFSVFVSSFVTDAFIIIFMNPLSNEHYKDLPLLRTELWTLNIPTCLMSKSHYLKMWLFLLTGP